MKIKLIFIFVSVLLLAACNFNTTSTPAANAPSVPVTGGTNVTIVNFGFSPAVLIVKVGTTVTWTNNDAAGHDIQAVDNSWGSTKVIKTSQTYSYTFTKIGVYPYRCGVHSEMKATVTVVK